MPPAVNRKYWANFKDEQTRLRRDIPERR